MNNNETHTVPKGRTSLGAWTMCQIWRHLPVGAARRLEPLLEHSAVTRVFPRGTWMTVDPRGIRRRLIKTEACSRAQRRKFFQQEAEGWRETDFRESYQYRLIQDIWDHQDDLASSSIYQELLAGIHRGKAFHRTGRRHFVVDTEAGLIDYMSGYLKIMQGMQADGYRMDAAPDELTVAVAANGELLQTSGGKHRLAMAQVLGLSSIPVRIRHISSAWWCNHTQDAREPAREALVRVMQALPGRGLA